MSARISRHSLLLSVCISVPLLRMFSTYKFSYTSTPHEQGVSVLRKKQSTCICSSRRVGPSAVFKASLVMRSSSRAGLPTVACTAPNFGSTTAAKPTTHSITVKPLFSSSSFTMELLRTPRCRLNTEMPFACALGNSSQSFSQQPFVSFEFTATSSTWQSCSAEKCAKVTSAAGTSLGLVCPWGMYFIRREATSPGPPCS
mmetsp:Transcript_31847/g.70166  ORF Transcript_31847/g.70166 Transcript_31847/m.70166 type:complete len:200 (-) Transcript_31847:314-913(-)